MIKYSIIIPHKDSLDSIPRLLKSIPNRNDIEIIIVDNSTTPISKNDIKGCDNDFILIASTPERFAGGARNLGLDHSHGEWIIFADADDFFTPNAFDIFESHYNDASDLIYFKSESVYDDTLEPSDRHLLFNSYIDDYLNGKSSEIECRLDYLVPWGKMIRHELINQHHIRFDEVLAANDVMFSTLVGFYSEKFSVDTRSVYIITTRKASLANRRDLPVVKSRFLVALRRNDFLKKHGLSNNQGSVMVYIFQAKAFGLKEILWFLGKAFSYKQNIFIGMRNWFCTYKRLRSENKKNKKYIR